MGWWEFTDGKLLPQTGPFRIDCSAPGPLEDMPWAGDVPVVSNRLKLLIDRHAPGCAQFLPAIMYFNGIPLDCGAYWIVNWLTVADCIDWNNSVFTVSSDGANKRTFKRIVIRSAIIAVYPILRVKEYEVMTLIRSDIKQIFDDNRITGCQYRKVNES